MPPSSPPLVLIPGEINLDLILHGFDAFPTLGREVLVDECLPTLGSASAITAVGLARLGVPVRFVGKVGADAWGDQCLETMRAAEVDTTFVERSADTRTGVTVAISSAVDRALVTYPGAIAELTGADVPSAAWHGAAHLHLSSYYLQEGLRPSVPELFRQARDRGMTMSLDPGGDPTAQWRGGVRDAIALADVFLPNAVELEGIGGDPDPVRCLTALEAEGRQVVAKLGERGSLALVDGRPESVPAPDVDVVDTTGAGDSFNAGFLAAWLGRRTLVECMRDGVCCGALATRGLGGTTTQADAHELAELRAAHFGGER
jgi:sugar/nucleoside kinase (ribokinase family)